MKLYDRFKIGVDESLKLKESERTAVSMARWDSLALTLKPKFFATFINQQLVVFMQRLREITCNTEG